MITRFIRRRRVAAVAKKLCARFGEHNLRRPFSFAVPRWRREWFERNMDRLDNLFHGRPAFTPPTEDHL